MQVYAVLSYLRWLPLCFWRFHRVRTSDGFQRGSRLRVLEETVSRRGPRSVRKCGL